MIFTYVVCILVSRLISSHFIIHTASVSVCAFAAVSRCAHTVLCFIWVFDRTFGTHNKYLAHLLICYSLQYIKFGSFLLPSSFVLPHWYSCQSWMSLNKNSSLHISFCCCVCVRTFNLFLSFIHSLSFFVYCLNEPVSHWECLCVYCVYVSDVCCQMFLLRFNKFQFEYHTSYNIILYIHSWMQI